MKLKDPLVSCLILSCGRSSVNECIHSIRENTNVPYEIILVDNGRGASIITQSYVDIYIGLKDNLGVLARNYGKLVARGKYILCIDDDVTMLSGWDEIFLGTIAEGPDTVAVGPMGHFVYKDLSNYNEKPGFPNRYVDVLTGFCWMHRNMPEGILPWDYLGINDVPLTVHEETWIQFCMRENGWRFRQTPMVCVHRTQRGEMTKDSWIDHDEKVKRIQNRFKIEDLHLEKYM